MAARARPVRFSDDDRDYLLDALRLVRGPERDWALEHIGRALAEYRSLRRADAHKKPTSEIQKRHAKAIESAATRLTRSLLDAGTETIDWLLVSMRGFLGAPPLPPITDASAAARNPEDAVYERFVGDLILVRHAASLAVKLIQGRKRGGPRTDDAATALAVALAVIWQRATKQPPTLTEKGERPTYLLFVKTVFEVGTVESGADRAAARALKLLRETESRWRNLPPRR